MHMTRFEVVVGDIADYQEHQTEAYVVAANNELWMGAGVAGAIKRVAGESVEQEALDQGPIEVGDAVLTSAGSMPPPAKALIHAAAMGFTDRTQVYANRQSVESATASALQLCTEHQIRSVTFPALGTGVGGLDIEGAAQGMSNAFRQHLAGPNPVDRIRIVVTTDDRKTIFDQAVAALG